MILLQDSKRHLCDHHALWNHGCYHSRICAEIFVHCHGCILTVHSPSSACQILLEVDKCSKWPQKISKYFQTICSIFKHCAVLFNSAVGFEGLIYCSESCQSVFFLYLLAFLFLLTPCVVRPPHYVCTTLFSCSCQAVPCHLI